MSNFIKIKGDINELLELAATHLTQSERAEIQRFLEVGEYGLSLETFIDIIVEERKPINLVILNKCNAIAAQMDMSADICEKIKMIANQREQLKARLLRILNELEKQPHALAGYPPDMLPFADQMKQIHEYIELAGEYGIAYESLVATVEIFPFSLSGKAAISLLELGLLLGFKTDRNEDIAFDRRNDI